jgi:hypothetical protein
MYDKAGKYIRLSNTQIRIPSPIILSLKKVSTPGNFKYTNQDSLPSLPDYFGSLKRYLLLVILNTQIRIPSPTLPIIQEVLKDIFSWEF